MLGQTLKLIGNSAYGSMLMDTSKHSDIIYSDDIHETQRYVNDKRFKNITELSNELFEIEMAKRTTKFDLPIQIGFFILQYAKLLMLQFYYEFLDCFIDRQKFQLVCMDTDSFYLALSESDLESCVKPSMKLLFNEQYNKWFPRKYPLDVNKYDMRTPGLFKTEFQGDKIIALCSKTYCIEKFSNLGGEK